jgi:hypothetical protein
VPHVSVRPWREQSGPKAALPAGALLDEAFASTQLVVEA